MVTYSLSFELEGLPKMANIQNGKSHWRYADAERKKWQTWVTLAVSRKMPPLPLKRVSLVLVRFSSSEPDYDGLVRGFKSIVDGLVRAGVLADDKLSNTGKWDCDWQKCKPKLGKVSITVTEVL